MTRNLIPHLPLKFAPPPQYDGSEWILFFTLMNRKLDLKKKWQHVFPKVSVTMDNVHQK